MSTLAIQNQLAIGGACQGIKDFASRTANWVGKTVSNGYTIASRTAVDTAQKVNAYARPVLQSVKEFATYNKAGFGLTLLLGAVLGYSLVKIGNALFCKTVQPVVVIDKTGTTKAKKV